jgi:hypothetical protein
MYAAGRWRAPADGVDPAPVRPDLRGWVGPSVYASQLPALFDGNNTEAGGVVALGDGTSSNITWNYFYVLPPNIPSGSIPIQIRSSWFVEVIGGSGSIGQLTIQMHAGTQGGGQVDLAFGNATPVAYPVNFVLAPSWTFQDLYFGMLANAAIGVTEIFALLYYAEPPSAHFTVPGTNGAVIGHGSPDPAVVYCWRGGRPSVDLPASGVYAGANASGRVRRLGRPQPSGTRTTFTPRWRR